MTEQSKPVVSDVEPSKIQNYKAIPPNLLARADRVIR